jgi:MmyB-like transcription regulator ligand binding domain
LVADLRLTAARYPADQRLKRLIRDLSAQSARFAELWEAGVPEPHQDFGRRKVIDHPDVGHIALDCDTLVVAADDLRIMIYTAEPAPSSPFPSLTNASPATPAQDRGGLPACPKW